MTQQLLLLLACFLCLSSIKAQKKDEILVPSIPYDSTANFLKDDVAKYTGQELWLKKLPPNQRELGYSNFVLNYKKSADLNEEKNVYKCCDGYNSKYQDLADKHFFVEQVFKHEAKDKNTGERTQRTYLKLKELDSGDVVYYYYEGLSEYSFPFVVMGYLEKQKSIIVGQKFVFASELLDYAVDLNTNKSIKSVLGDKWKCIDLTVDNLNFELSMIVENSKKQQIAVPLSAYTNRDLPRKVYTLSESADMLKRFGLNNYNRILQQKIASNMSKEMCKMSWGEPIDIEKSGNTEKWIYPQGSITFKGNKIIKMN